MSKKNLNVTCNYFLLFVAAFSIALALGFFSPASAEEAHVWCLENGPSAYITIRMPDGIWIGAKTNADFSCVVTNEGYMFSMGALFAHTTVAEVYPNFDWRTLVNALMENNNAPDVIGPFSDGSILVVTPNGVGMVIQGPPDGDPRSASDLVDAAEQVVAQGGFDYSGDFGDPGVGGYGQGGDDSTDGGFE